MPMIRSIKPRKPISYVEIDTSNLAASLRTQKKLMEILRKDVDLWREGDGETSLQFRWNHKTVEVQHMSLVVLMSDFELCIIEPEDPPIGNVFVDYSHRASREHMIGGIG